VSRGLGVLALALAGAFGITAAAAVAGGKSAPPAPRDSLASSIAPRPAVAAATAWCGQAAQADRVPNVVAGNPVHWVYLIPSDGSDNLGGLASVMQSDAEQIDAWWRAQDPARTPRNDLASFSCGAQLDITTVRSSRTSAQLTPLGGRFPGIVSSLEQAGFRSPFTKYLVYYDGPVSDANVCGQGASDSGGFGVAVVFYRGCTGVSTAAVAVHELVHTFGAVSGSAPNDCPGESSGHACDAENDLMYPRVGGDPLAAKVLDAGRDDYYGHPGGWTDTQDSAWLVRLDGQAPIALTISGPGSVSADVPGLQCAASCTTTWNSGQRLALRATPHPGSKFVRWEGACSGSAGCALTVGAGSAVTAVFGPASFLLRVSVAGRGAVRSSQAGITCRSRCSATVPASMPVLLTATPAKGWKLRSWSGACRGSKKTCTVPMNAASSARATFVRR
jgi:Divergent InlB B-repeat domain